VHPGYPICLAVGSRDERSRGSNEREGPLDTQCRIDCLRIPSWACSPSQFPLAVRFLQPLGHLVVLLAVERPTLCRAVPAVVLDGHVDAAVDEESHRLVVPRKEDQMVQDARWFMR